MKFVILACLLIVASSSFLPKNNVGLSKTWTLQVGKSGSGTSPLPISVTGSCTVEKLDGVATVCGYATAGTITINGNQISNDQSSMSCFQVSQGTTLQATASAGAGAYGIYKSGNGPLTVTCTANLLEEETVAANNVGLSKTWTLQVGKSGSGTSPLPIPVSGSCTVNSLVGEGTLCGYATAGTITINGNQISSDQSSMTCITVKQNDVLNATASAGAGAYGIYKSGNGPITVTCSANLLEEESTQALTKVFTLKPGQSGNGTSPLPIPVTGTCQVTQLTGQAIVCGYAMSGTVTINGQNLSNDQSSMNCFTLTQGSSLDVSVSASAGAYGIYKTGTSPLTLTCNVNLLEQETVAANNVGISKTWTLQVGKSGSGTSPLPIPVSGSCTVVSLVGQGVVCGYATSGTITINGNQISSSQSSMSCFTVSQNTVLQATASAGAGAYGIYKSGNGPLTVTCSANLLEKETVAANNVGLSKTWTLQVGKSGSGTSPLPIPVSGSCTVDSLVGEGTMCGYATAGTITINGNQISNDQSSMTCIQVKQGDVLNATASAGAGAYGIYKSGNGPITVTCSANLMQKFEIQDLTESFTIQPGQSKSGTSPLPIPVTGTCTCTSLTGTATLCVYVSNGSASINGNAVSTSSSNPTCEQVQQGTQLSISASAAVTATGVYKTGNGPLTATCNINLMDYLVTDQ